MYFYGITETVKTFSISQISKILRVDKNIVKRISFIFSEFLSNKANPSKGTPKIFEINDLRVIAFILVYWEENPDIENIKIGLNTNGHFEHPLITDLIIENTPIFDALPEDINEDWTHGIVFGGLSEFGDIYYLAKSYKLAGDHLVEIALENGEARELGCPIIYNYRHSIELYMKGVIGKYKKNHDLAYLLKKLKEKFKKDFNAEIPEWFENIISTFTSFDPNSTLFRYGDGLKNEEVFIDFYQLKTIMTWISDSFERISIRI